MRLRGRLSRLLDLTENALAFVSIITLYLIVGLIVFDVIGRRWFSVSLPWIVEFAEFYLLFATFMCSGWVLREHGHIAIDLIHKYFSAEGIRRLRLVAYLITFVAALYILWFNTQLLLSYVERGSVQGHWLVLPQWIWHAPIPVGMLLFLVELTRQFFRSSGGEL